MKTRRLVWVFVASLAFTGVGPARGETVDEALDKLTQTYGKLKSYTARIRHYQSVSTSSGNSMKSESEGTVEFLRHEGKILYRAEAKDSAVQKTDGKETKVEGTSLNVSDGEYFYALSDNEGQKTVIKQRPDPMLGADPKTMVDKLRDEHNIKLGVEQVFDGEDCYVFDIMPKKQEDHPMMGKTQLYFRKSDGIRAQTVGIDPSGAPLFMSITRDVKVNVDIPLDRFKFTKPPDAQLLDMSEGK